MKLRLALFSSLFLPFMAWAQLPIVPIQNIQGWAGQFQPDSCNDGPNPVYLNDTVRVKGVVITPGGLNETTGSTRWIWIRDVTATASTPFGNITVRASGITSPTDINTLIAGDTIEVIGTVSEFNQGSNGNGETQLNPIPNGVFIISEDAGPAPLPVLVGVGELNGNLNVNNQPSNNILTGEKYEGNFVEIQNVTVVSVDLNVADRCRILVKDANNNHIWIYDRFKTQRISAGFVPPNVGDSYTSVKGIIEGWKNICAGTAATNRGYNMNPFSLTHYVKGASSPAIGNIKKSKSCPLPADAINISADVTDDGSVSSVEFLYSTNGTSYTPVNATALGTRYSAQIPAQANGTTVRYYVRAKDNLNNTTVQPNVPGNINPLFYVVNSDGCTIKDIQFTPFTNGRSGYVGDTVVVQGIVTSQVNGNLGYVHMQQPGLTSWGGIWVNGGTLISGLSIGDQVNITGVVEESFGLTRISNITNSAVVASGQPVPAPLELDPALFTTYSATGASQNEQYEGMLVKLKNPVAGQNLFVVDSNADAATNRNNGEYRIGADVNDPNTGCRVLAGRQNSNTFSSLNVRYVNSPRWFTQDGQMNVPAEIVLPGSEVTFIQGVMTYSFGNMKLLPRNDLDITLLILSTRELTGNNQFGLFPNPAKETLHIKIEASSTSNVEIFNAKGQKVLSTTVNGKDNTIAIDKLVNGLYQVRVSEPSKKLIGVRNLLIQK